jgi:chemotaxis protein MotA
VLFRSIGIFSAFGLVIISIAIGGGLKLFIDLPSLLIVVGGTLGATMINYPLKEVFGAVAVIKNVFLAKKLDDDGIPAKFVQFATKARREGILALEPYIKEVDNAFLKKGLQLSVDGLEPQAISDILDTEVESMKERHQLGAEIFATMAAFAPALGMIGTLIGLVQMLQSMDDPSRIGPAMAVALLTTFYGSILANLVFLPISGKLKTRSKEEALNMEIIKAGVISLTNGDNPRILEQKILVYMPPKNRSSAFD